MTWVKLDEEFARHPKVLAAGPLGMAMQVAALCYCNQYLTDGFVPRSAAVGLLDLHGLGMKMWQGEMVGGGEDASWELIVKDLVEAGLWEAVESGWRIHDFNEYQPSKIEVLELRRQRSEAGRKGGKASAKAKAQASASANGQAKSKPGTVPVTEPVPMPVLPDVEGSALDVAPFVAHLKDADEETAAILSAYRRRLPEAAFHRALEALKERKANGDKPPLESETRYFVATLNSMLKENQYA